MRPAPLSAAVARVVRRVGLAAALASIPLTTSCATTDATSTAPVAPGTTAPRASTTGTSPPSTAGTTAPPTSPPSTAPPDPAFTPEQQAVADAYQRAIGVIDRSHQAANPTDPGLAETMVDPMLRQQRVTLTNMYDAGEATRFPSESARAQVVRRVEVRAGAATIFGCSIDDGIRYKVDSGEIVNDDVSTVDFRAELRLIEGTWKLSTREFSNERVGVQPCGA